MNFDSFRFDPRLRAGIQDLGYVTPTPIQAQALPHVLGGRDVMGLAQTGTGKTAVFALPILQRLLAGPRGAVRALVVAPTRELAEQIHDDVLRLGAHTSIRCATVYGGVGLEPQIRTLRSGVEVVVACPGRLLDHIQRRTINLSRVEVLVIDEADRMFDMGFLPDVRRIIASVPKQRQTLMFSATMPPDIRRLAKEALRDPITVQVGHAAPADTVAHALYPVPQHLKTPLLLELRRRLDPQSVLVFTRTKHRAKRVGRQLEQAGYRAASIQGNLSQNRRQAALDGFRDGSFRILVATDIAARGIDVSDISHVINYDMPDTADAYTHRIGRTGRADKTGDALTLVTSDDADMIRAIERILGAPLARRTLEGFDYRTPAPVRDTEFARAPYPPRRPPRRTPGAPPRTPEPPRPAPPPARPAAAPSRPQTAPHPRTQPRRHSYGFRPRPH
ncbi:MAG: DEAD/DEAH box helicase [Deltaproteobacteria bacterium]|nr:DEAD/DEAH box helicase [Deltaproteobacteria bacterium]